MRDIKSEIGKKLRRLREEKGMTREAVSYTHIQRDYMAGIGTQIAAVFGFVTNFFEMATGGSYESNFIPHLFLHTWSLALEVHYYVLLSLIHIYRGRDLSLCG